MSYTRQELRLLFASFALAGQMVNPEKPKDVCANAFDFGEEMLKEFEKRYGTVPEERQPPQFEKMDL